MNNTSAWVQAEARTVVVKKYYSVPSAGSGQAAGQRVAMRSNGVLYYLHSDHLGSTSLTTNESGSVIAEQKYLPYGEVRWESGSLPTDRQYTDQRREAALGDIYDYKARFYSPYLGRFLSADTIVPGVGSQALNRYMYVKGNAIGYRDPSGHCGGPKSWCLAFETFGAALDDLIWHNSQYELDLYIRSEYRFVGGYDQFRAMTVYSWNWERPNQDTSNQITTQDAKTRIEELEGKNSKAHTWDKHSPTLEADQKLQKQAAEKPGSVQTRFTDPGEMVRSIDQTIDDNMSQIQTQAAQKAKGKQSYLGESVHYSGYVYKDGNIQSIWGMARVNVVIWFDGLGGWYLHTAYPQAGEK